MNSDLARVAADAATKLGQAEARIKELETALAAMVSSSQPGALLAEGIARAPSSKALTAARAALRMR